MNWKILETIVGKSENDLKQQNSSHNLNNMREAMLPGAR
jgi:hypothetical protein